MNNKYSPFHIGTSILILLVLTFSNFKTTHAQDPSDAATRSLLSWLSLDAPPGAEHLTADVIQKSTPGWKRDGLGNLILSKGSGSPRRVVACGLDRPGFAVTEITESGYLRLRESGTGRQHPLWVQFHEGQRIRVLTRHGVVPGVVTVKSTHLQRGRVPNAPLTNLDDLWVDVGAESKTDVRRLGIALLDPVVRDMAPWAFADFVSAPSSGLRVGCAAVASAAQGTIKSGETIFLLTTLRSMGHDGLEAALRSLGRVDEVFLIDQAAEGATQRDGILQRRVEKPTYLPESTGLTSLAILSARVRYAGSLVESVQLTDANALLTAVEKAAAVSDSNHNWINLAKSTSPVKTTRSSVDTFAETATLLKTLADVYGVSGHEHKVREQIIASLPSWARQKATTDNEGNLVVEVGPDRDPVIFVAHQDEVGFEITSIANDGTVSLRTRGGLFQSLWEGQPALLHFDGLPNSSSLRGIFVPRETATAKQPEALTAWFGVDAAGLKQLGVTTGLSVTADKHSTRLGINRFTARALDDRAGSTALIMAARRLDLPTLNRKVIFAWSVREETGLEGAIALARRYGTVRRVYSIDTFVSSDSPAESSRFAFAPLGQGAVIRGLDNATAIPAAEIDRLINMAKLQRIPLQVGATNGGTDGSEFTRYGVINISLSWPGRYSHSPVEVLDLRDLQSLSRLIYAIAIAK